MSDNVVSLGNTPVVLATSPEEIAKGLEQFALEVRTGIINTDAMVILYAERDGTPCLRFRGRIMNNAEVVGLIEFCKNRLLMERL
jgi:hypothetical protein